jgi:hypothetical protein
MVPRPEGRWDPSHRTLNLRPGALHVDVVGGQIVSGKVVMTLAINDARSLLHEKPRAVPVLSIEEPEQPKPRAFIDFATNSLRH